MADLLLQDVDPVLVERIRRISVARAWSQRQTLLALLEQGLFASELDVRSGLENREVDVLSEAIAALQGLPTGPNF
ncbi:hypothetical protein [Xanthomonas massiliensis]|jgi:hypothetical protein|uniref:hypothetical protein n=1 Tax=Xanthomonas massiliensis TaxID=1720302 RepID=UPI0008251DB0|nr:hypothetical protein [Xanthomonas massiliensis]